MIAPPTRSGATRAGRLAAPALALGLTFALLAGAERGHAAGAPSTGSAILTLSGPAANALTSAKVTTSAKRGATLKRTTATLPVAATVVSRGATVGLTGRIVFAAGRRTATFSGLRLAVATSRRVTVTATLAGTRVTFLTGAAPTRGLTLDGTYGRAGFGATSMSLPKATATALRTRLKLRRTPTGRIGRLTLVAPAAPSPTTPTTTAPTTTPSPTTPTTPAPVTDAPSLPRPAGALDIRSATVTWHPRDSWSNYVSSGTGSNDGTSFTGGAAALSPNSACGSNVIVRDVQFPFRSGWFDPASGQSLVQFDGAVRYQWGAHGIDLSFPLPEILVGPTSAVTFVGATGRARLLDLDPASAPLAKRCDADPGPQSLSQTTAATGRTYERVPATMAAGAASVFAGGPALDAYPVGSQWGWITIAFSTVS